MSLLFGDCLRPALMASAAIVCVTTATPATAQVRTFNVPGQDAARGVAAFARQADVQILISASDARGRRTNAVRGNLTIEQALQQLVVGTGLRAQQTGAQTWSVVPASGEAEAAGAAADREGAYDQSLVVTGTRITGAAPIAQTIVATREDIQESGRTSIVDYITTIPQIYLSNSGATALSNLGGVVDQSFSSAVSLRGLGAESTLTLLNGRRMAPSGGAAFGAITDISGIPVGAIERIEIIPDGSSAIYGSDALGGVVNIILRRSFDGAEIGGSYGFGRGGKPENRRVTIGAGHSWRNGSILAFYERLELGNLRTLDREFTSTRDLRPRGGGDFRSTFSAPGTVTAVDGNLNRVQQAFGLSAPVPFAALPAGTGTALTPGSVTPNVRNFQDVFPDASIFPGDKRDSVWVALDQSLGGSISAFATLMYSRRDIRVNFSPPSQTVNVPASNAFNPFGEAVRVSYTYLELGGQVLDRRLTALAATIGLRGEFGGGWSWDLALGHAQSRYRADTSLEIDTVGQAPLLASSDPSVALNVFGDGSGQNLSSLRSILFPRVEAGKGLVQSATGIVRGSLGGVDFGAGPVGLAFGGEYRRESQNIRSIPTRPGAPAPTEFGGPDRHLWAAFAEARLPFFGTANARPGLRELEISLAARAERYSDFGSSFNPRAALQWRPIDTLAFRAAISHSFRAPSLELMFGPSSTSCCSLVADPKRGNQVVGVTVDQSRNPDLEAETSTSRALGVIWSPLGRSGDLVAELNYYRIDARQRVISLSTIPLIEAEDVLPPGLVIRDAAGVLTRLVLKPFNSATDLSEGFDGRIGVGRETPIGYFRAQLSGVYQTRLERQLVRNGAVVDNSRSTGFSPKWKVRGALSWRLGGLNASAFLNHIPGATNTTFRLPNGALQEVRPWTTVDLSAAYDFGDQESPWLRGFRLSVSVLNLFDRDPPFTNGFLAYDPTRSDPRGRFINISLEKRF